MKNIEYTVIALALFALAELPDFSLVQADQVTMLTDFGLPKSASPSQFIDVNGTLFFVAGSSELWRSDGTAAGTFRVKEGLPGARVLYGSLIEIGNLVNVKGALFFTSYDDAHGYELWKSDGTAAGTVLVKAGAISEIGTRPLNLNGTLFFAGVNGLWKSDGTETGTVLVKEVVLGETWGWFTELVNVNGTLFFIGADSNGALFFTADDGEHGVQLWKYVTDPVTNGRPVLKIARAGNQVALSWPADGGGYTLEATSDLSSSFNWSKVPRTPAIVDDKFTIIDSVTSRNQFYRLKK